MNNKKKYKKSFSIIVAILIFISCTNAENKNSDEHIDMNAFGHFDSY